MNKFGTDSKVRKTLVRNCEKKVRPAAKPQVVREVEPYPSNVNVDSLTSLSQKDNELNQPTLCSSEALANYLSCLKKTAPPPLSVDDLKNEQEQLCAKVTKKLNFHFNDRIYKNLIELNATIEESKTRKEKRVPSTSSIKKDLEPNIEDFCEDVKEFDSPASIAIIKPKFKPVKKIEDGQLHMLVASFEVL